MIYSREQAVLKHTIICRPPLASIAPHSICSQGAPLKMLHTKLSAIFLEQAYHYHYHDLPASASYLDRISFQPVSNLRLDSTARSSTSILTTYPELKVPKSHAKNVPNLSKIPCSNHNASSNNSTSRDHFPSCLHN